MRHVDESLRAQHLGRFAGPARTLWILYSSHSKAFTLDELCASTGHDVTDEQVALQKLQDRGLALFSEGRAQITQEGVNAVTAYQLFTQLDRRHYRSRPREL